MQFSKNFSFEFIFSFLWQLLVKNVPVSEVIEYLNPMHYNIWTDNCLIATYGIYKEYVDLNKLSNNFHIFVEERWFITFWYIKLLGQKLMSCILNNANILCRSILNLFHERLRDFLGSMENFRVHVNILLLCKSYANEVSKYSLLGLY